VLELASLTRAKNQNISGEELFTNLAEIWTKLGRQPFCSELTSQTSKYGYSTYFKRFGSWRKSLEAFVAWANEGEVQAIETLSQSATTSRRQEAFRHRTSRTINYRLRFLVMRRDNFKCRISGRSPATDPSVILEVDHIVPWDKGGETVMENLQTLAKEINIGKSNLDMYQDD
jgi:5-methylcytosine-specific restriction endonuclease McrA